MRIVDCGTTISMEDLFMVILVLLFKKLTAIIVKRKPEENCAGRYRKENSFQDFNQLRLEVSFAKVINLSIHNNEDGTQNASESC